MTDRSLVLHWSPRAGFAVLIAFVLLYTGFSAGHMYWVKYTVGFEAYLGHGPRMPPKLLLTSQWLKATAIVLVLWWVALRPHRLDWRALGVRGCEPRWLFVAAVGAVLAFVLAVLLAKLMATQLPDWARFMRSRYAWGDAPPWQMLLLVATTVGVTPLVEELFFRGFLLPWMLARHRRGVAIAVCAVLFGASHLVPWQAFVAALLSLLLIWLYLRSGSIWPSVLCHAINNALGVGLGMAATAGMLPAALTPPS